MLLWKGRIGQSRDVVSGEDLLRVPPMKVRTSVMREIRKTGERIFSIVALVHITSSWNAIHIAMEYLILLVPVWELLCHYYLPFLKQYHYSSLNSVHISNIF